MVNSLTRTFLPLALLALSACGGDDDSSKNSPPPAACASVCAQQNKLCDTTNECASSCTMSEQSVAKAGCGAQYQALLECQAKEQVCDIGSTECPETDFQSCYVRYCANNPMDEICK